MHRPCFSKQLYLVHTPGSSRCRQLIYQRTAQWTLFQTQAPVEQGNIRFNFGASAASRITINGNQDILSFSASSSRGCNDVDERTDFFTVNDLSIRSNSYNAARAYGILFTGAILIATCFTTVPYLSSQWYKFKPIPVVFGGSSSSYSTMGPSGSYNAIRSCTPTDTSV